MRRIRGLARTASRFAGNWAVFPFPLLVDAWDAWVAGNLMSVNPVRPPPPVSKMPDFVSGLDSHWSYRSLSAGTLLSTVHRLLLNS